METLLNGDELDSKLKTDVLDANNNAVSELNDSKDTGYGSNLETKTQEITRHPGYEKNGYPVRLQRNSNSRPHACNASALSPTLRSLI